MASPRFRDHIPLTPGADGVILSPMTIGGYLPGVITAVAEALHR